MKIKLKNLILPIVLSVDFFNVILQSHQKRTSLIAYTLGSALDLPKKDIIDLTVASLFHDLGALPHISKKSILNVENKDRYKHSEKGYIMLSELEEFQRYGLIIRNHHKNYIDLSSSREDFLSNLLRFSNDIEIINFQMKSAENRLDYITDYINKKIHRYFPEFIDVFLQESKIDAFWYRQEFYDYNKIFELIDIDDYSVDLNLKELKTYFLILLQIIDLSEQYTVTHSYSVGNLANTIGKWLGYDEEYCEKLLIAGYLHDIGKLNVPNSIINNTGKLTAEQYELVKTHSFVSGVILDSLKCIDGMSEIFDLIIYHHERLDGTGYPYSKSLVELSKGSRILNFCDVLCALNEERPYRKRINSKESMISIVVDELKLDMDQELKAFLETNIDDLLNEIETFQKESKEMFGKFV